jgi:site-specific DNA-methyltransferase (adenine-specific)
MWNGMLQGKNILEGHKAQGNKRLNEKRIHPTQKPVALYNWLFSKYANSGDKILDTHLGSGSSRISAYDAKLDFTGIELNEIHFLNQEKRFKEHIAQLQLF